MESHQNGVWVVPHCTPTPLCPAGRPSSYGTTLQLFAVLPSEETVHCTRLAVHRKLRRRSSIVALLIVTSFPACSHPSVAIFKNQRIRILNFHDSRHQQYSIGYFLNMRAQQLGRALYRAVVISDSTTQRSLTTLTSSSFPKFLSSQVSHGNYFSRTGNGDYRILDFPWSATQRRGVKVNAIHVRHGNVIERAGRMYRILEVAHKQHGRGGAMMQVEVRDVDNGNKLSLRFGPEESVERLFVEEKSFTCLYTENDSVYLIEPDTFEQVEVPLEMFGKAAAYLKESLKVKLQLHDGRPLAASIPKHVTCTVKEIQPVMKGSAATTRYTKAVLDNGLNVQVPAYLKVGEEIVFDTEDDSFLKRANK